MQLNSALRASAVDYHTVGKPSRIAAAMLPDLSGNTVLDIEAQHHGRTGHRTGRPRASERAERRSACRPNDPTPGARFGDLARPQLRAHTRNPRVRQACPSSRYVRAVRSHYNEMNIRMLTAKFVRVMRLAPRQSRSGRLKLCSTTTKVPDVSAFQSASSPSLGTKPDGEVGECHARR